MADQEDWASRRKHAMSRARELRSRIKEAEHQQGSSDASLASRSEMQRQRRSRQLEATQKLLDGQAGGFSLTAASSGTSVGSRSQGGRTHAHADERYESGSARAGRGASTQRSSHEERSVGEGSRGVNDGRETHSIISQKHIRRIHERYKTPMENDSLSLASKPVLDRDERSTRYRFEEDDRSGRRQESNPAGGRSFESPSKDAIPKHAVRQSLIQKPLEGRGRGRGRRKSPLGSSSLGESLTRKPSPTPHASTIVEDQMADSQRRQPSSTSYPPRRGNSDASRALSQSYLRGRQVPAYKEGECEKLATLRRRLVARRQKRRGKENAKPASTRSVRSHQSAPKRMSRSPERSLERSQGRTRERSPERSRERSLERSLARLDPNDYSASDFQRKPKQRNHDAMPSPSRVPAHEPEEHRSDSPEARMDTSPFSSPHSNRAEEDEDDEASVVQIQLMKCEHCKRSFAPKVYAKHFDSDGQPKCAAVTDKKRGVFNSAKARIANNSNLNSDEQRTVLQAQKKATKELSKKLSGKSSRKRNKKGSKWKEESATFREAMKANRLISKAEREGKPAHYYL